MVLLINVGVTVARNYPKKSPICGGQTGSGFLWGIRDSYPAQWPFLVRRTRVVAGVNGLMPTYPQFASGTCRALANSKQCQRGSGAQPRIRGPLPCSQLVHPSLRGVVPHHAFVDRSTPHTPEPLHPRHTGRGSTPCFTFVAP